MKRTILLLTLILVSISVSYSQDASKNSIRFGAGPGVTMTATTDGLGLFYTVGYQRELKNDRFRLNPNFSIGHYSNKFITDSRDLYYNSISLSTHLYYDLLKVASSSLFIGGGSVLNNTRGLLGTGGDMEGNNSSSGSEFVSTYHIGGALSLGLRLTKPESKNAFNIIPLNIRYGGEHYSEILFTIEWEINY